MPTKTFSNNIPRGLRNTKEVLIPQTLQFTGKIPSWLKGTLLASGPGTFDLEEGSVKGWMDGYTMISKFELDGNSIKFSSKHVQSTSYQKAVKAKRPVVPEFGTPPGEDSGKGFFARLIPTFSPKESTDNCNGRVLKFGSHYYAVSDSTHIHEIDPHTLATLNTSYISKTIGLNSFAVEVQQDDKTGDILLMGPVINPTFHYTVMRMPVANKDNELEKKFQQLGSIPSRWKFGACGPRACFTTTENYIIFIEIPLVINILKIAATYIKGYRMADWLEWRPTDGTRFYVLNKHTGKVFKTEFYAENSFLAVDIINAYDDGEKIILDVCIMRDESGLEALNLEKLRSFLAPDNYNPGVFHRYVIPLVSDVKLISAEVESLLPPSSLAKALRVGDRIVLSPQSLNPKDSQGFDAGVINPCFLTRDYSYVYIVSHLAAAISGKSSINSSIAKMDVRTGNKIILWEPQTGEFPRKPVFIPNPKGIDEDDGLLITVVKYVCEESFKPEKDYPDFLVAIDAKSMKEIARAEFKNCEVFSWFHAQFMAT